MKKLILLLIAFLVSVSMAVHAQKNKPRALTPARGHYKQLMDFDPKAKSPAEEIDKQTFFTDKETIERRMSIKPFYLQNVTVDDFKIPDVPDNSSPQTRAEINYLLALQKYRTGEDMRSSLYMAKVYYNLRVKPNDSTYNR